MENFPEWYFCANYQPGMISAVGGLIHKEGGVGAIITVPETVKRMKSENY